MTNAEKRLEEAKQDLQNLIQRFPERYRQHRDGDQQRDFNEAELSVREWEDEVKAELTNGDC